MLVVNESPELTFRDFKKAENTSTTLQIPVNLIHQEFEEAIITEGLTYISLECFLAIIIKLPDYHFDDVIVIIDEFDSVIFTKRTDVCTTRAMMLRLRKLIGLTGSEFKEFHSRAFE